MDVHVGQIGVVLCLVEKPKSQGRDDADAEHVSNVHCVGTMEKERCRATQMPQLSTMSRGACTYKPPIAKIAISTILCFLRTCKLLSTGIGRRMIMRSVRMLSTDIFEP